MTGGTLTYRRSALQLLTWEVFARLDEGRDLLPAREYQCFIDLVLRRVAREAIRIDLDGRDVA